MKKILYILAFLVVFAGGVGVGNHYSLPVEVDSKQSDLPISVNNPEENYVYRMNTQLRSFFLRDEKGGLVPIQIDGKRYFKPGEDIYNNNREIEKNRTALIVMDPWEDSGSDFLNKHFAPVYYASVLPLVNKAVELNLPIIILTNDPSKTNVDYGSRVYPELRLLTEQGKAKILFHQDYNGDSFAKYLNENGINTLIYSGFASNMCVIGRPMGMIPMQTHGFKLYFVPEASAGVEFQDSWDTGAVHEATTKIISQWVGELIDLKEFMSLTPGTKTESS